MIRNIRFHFYLAVVLLFLFSILRIFTDKIVLGKVGGDFVGDITLGSLILLVYGIYLVFISMSYFKI